MNLLLLQRGEIADDSSVRLWDVRATHIRKVLKAVVGDEVRIGVLDGPRGTATISAINDEEVVLQCVLNSETPDRPLVDLLLALPRPKVMKRLWAQLSAIGVGRIILTNTWKVERNYFDTHVLDSEFYRPMLIEGLQQAQDTRLPEVSVHKQFKILVEDELDTLCPNGLRLLAHPGGDESLAAAAGALQSGERLLLAVGPEGGWIDYEIDLLKAHDFQPISMGDRTLRTDTACLALLAVLHDILRQQL